MPARHSVVPAVLFVLEKDGKVLLQLRQNTGLLDGMWSIPGGHFEPGEHILQTVIREAHEELGIVVEEEDIVLLGMHHMHRKDGFDGLNLYYKITAWEGEPANTDPDHCGGIQWFPKDALPINTNPEFHEIIEPKPTHMAIEGRFQPRLGRTK